MIDGHRCRDIAATLLRRRDRTLRRFLLMYALMSACMFLACAVSSGGSLDIVGSLAEPQEGPLPSLGENLARVVGSESAERADTLLHMLQELGFDPDIHEFSNIATDRDPRAVGRNLVVTLGEGHRDIVVGAHYDVVRLRGGGVVGGAVDNGAAAVLLTRVAEALQRHRLHHRVRIVFFDLEEVGLHGSRAYVQSANVDRIAAMVNVDVVAEYGTLIYGPTAHVGNDVVYRSLGIVCARIAITCMGFPQYPPSDDRSFQTAGIPNVSIGMIGAIASHQLWLMLNAGARSGLRQDFVPEILQVMHTTKDTIERVDRMAMTRVHDAIVALVLELDTALHEQESKRPSIR
ncbi:MAG: M28 family peptidase [bacterium]|nr:M28 family peptidase [bacterium]